MEVKAVIREANQTDIPRLVDLGSWLVQDYIGLTQDRSKIHKILTTAITSKMHKLLVAQSDGNLVGAMLTLSEHILYAEKMYAQIVALYACEPGVGAEMLKATMEWVQTRKAIQMVTYSMPIKTGVDKLLLNNKFKATGSMLVWRRYNGIF